jgi:hypothetical protein
MRAIPLTLGGKSIVITGITLAVVATLWMVLRFHSRYLKRTGIYPEDWMVLIALVSCYDVRGCSSH